MRWSLLRVRMRFGMILISFLVIFGANLSRAAAAAKPRKSPQVIKSKDYLDAYFLAFDLDKYRSTYWRDNVSGAYRTSFGTQIDESCMNLRERTSLSAHWYRQGVEDYLYTMVKSVAGSCRDRYPELDPYISQWVTQARRAVISCSENLGWMHGFTSPHGIYELKPHITLKNSAFLDGVKNFENSNSATLLIHELFHTTQANNRFDHGEIERIDFDAKDPCKSNMLDDRVMILGVLCSQGYGSSFAPAILQTLRFKIEACGIKSCEKLFTSNIKDTGLDKYLPTQGLSSSAAKSLCSKLSKQGQCQTIAFTKWHELWNRHPAVKSLQKELREIFSKVLAASINDSDIATAPTFSMLRTHYNNLWEMNYIPTYASDEDVLKDKKLRVLMGEKLFDDYLAALKWIHPFSPDFNCARVSAHSL